MPDTLRRDAVTRRQIVQGQLGFDQPAAGDDVAATLIESRQGVAQVVTTIVITLFLFQQHGRFEAPVDQVGGRHELLLLVFRADIERHIVSVQPLLHGQHVTVLDPELLGQRVDFTRAHPAQRLARAAQVEEQLALRLGGRDLDDAPVAQDELVHLGFDPMHGERHQAHADRWVKAFDRLHEADIALLDEVVLGQAVTAVAARHLHYKAQVSKH